MAATAEGQRVLRVAAEHGDGAVIVSIADNGSGTIFKFSLPLESA